MDLETLDALAPWEWPQNASGIIATALRDSQASADTRMLAAELAGELVVMDDEMAEILLAVATDDRASAELRGKAAISLGPALDEADTEGFDDPMSDPPISEDCFNRIRETLRIAYEDESAPKGVRRRTLEASVRAPEEWHANAVRHALATGDPEWKLTAAFAMIYVKGFDREITDLLGDRNPEVFFHAVQAAGNWGIRAAWPRISGLLTEESTPRDLLLAAIEAAPGVNADEAKPLLFELMDSEDEEIADAASEALAMSEIPAEDIDEEEDFKDEDEPGKSRPH